MFMLICVALLVLGCSREKVQKEPPAKPVETAIVTENDVPIFIDSFGNLTAPYSVDIKSQVTGQITEVHFKDGDVVSKGDMLFTIDPSPYKADLDKAEAALAEDQANLKLAIATRKRNKTLVEKELISQQDYDQCVTNVAALEAKVRLDYADIDLAKINLNYCYIRSPIDGLTGKRQVDPGNIVPANEGPVLVNIKTIDPLYIDFTVPEVDFYRVRQAMSEEKLKVQILPEGGTGKAHSGDLEFFDNTVDNTTGTISLRAVVENKDRQLWAGQFVRVRLILGIKKNAVLVPYESVQLGQKGAYLFVVTPDNKADLRFIKTGDREDDHIIVEDGVKTGEKVVTEGQLGLSPGVTVLEAGQHKGK